MNGCTLEVTTVDFRLTQLQNKEKKRRKNKLAQQRVFNLAGLTSRRLSRLGFDHNILLYMVFFIPLLQKGVIKREEQSGWNKWFGRIQHKLIPLTSIQLLYKYSLCTSSVTSGGTHFSATSHVSLTFLSSLILNLIQTAKIIPNLCPHCIHTGSSVQSSQRSTDCQVLLAKEQRSC